MSGPSPGSKNEPPGTSDSSFDLSGNLTDVTGDKSLLIDLTPDLPVDKHGSNNKDYLFKLVDNRSKSTPEKSESSSLLISNETGKTDSTKPSSEVYGKRKRSGSDDSSKMGWQNTTDDSVNSTEQSDRETSSKDESDFSSDEKLKVEPKKKSNSEFPSTVSVLKTSNGGSVYIVGTAHFSEESQNDVSKVIQKVKPHIVLVELCPQRVNMLKLDEKAILEEAQNINFKQIRAIIEQNGLYNSIIYILLLHMSAHITKQLGIAPGGEFRRALQEASQIPRCIVHLGDRPIQVTIHRAFSSLTWCQIIKLTWKMLTNNDSISKEDVEQYKQGGFLREMLADMENEFPALKKVFLEERDTYLTYSLQLAANTYVPDGPPRVVGVVGLGHVEGIVNKWEKVLPEAIPPIMTIPPTSTSSKVLKASLKIAVIGLICYAGYKCVPKKFLSV